MAGFRKPETPRDQMVLWPTQLDDAIAADHPVRHVAFLLASEPLATTFREWAGSYVLVEGKPPYHPRDLTGLYLYGMMNRIRSSRQLERACWDHLDVIWLMSGQKPDHSTIAQFVKDHQKRLRQMFRDVLQVAIGAGLVKLEHVSIDGTNVEADAGRGSVHGEATIAAQMAKVEEQIRVLEAEWEANEAREQSLYGDSLPLTPEGSGSVKERLARVQAQQSRLREALEAIARRREEAPGREPKAIASVTDPSSRSMKDKEGRRKPNYNTQLGVDTTAGVIVGHGVNDQAEDGGLLMPMLTEVESTCGCLPDEASADSQYNTGPELEALEKAGVRGYLPASHQKSDLCHSDSPATKALSAAQAGQTLADEQWAALPKDGDGRITKEAFRYDREANVYRCPMNQVLVHARYTTDQRRWGKAICAQYGNCSACATCPRAGMCCREPSKGRLVTRDQYEDHRERMRAWMDSEQGRSRYWLRRQTVEPRIGLIKHVLGVRRFLRRGMEAVRTEWSLVCTAVNVGILLRHWPEVVKTL